VATVKEQKVWTIRWADGLSVGIPAIDEDHKRFIALVNGFNESVANRMAVAEVKKRMQDLIDDAVEHFAHEERLFSEWRYPNADEHARIHAQLIKVLQHIKSTISYGHDVEWIEAGMNIKEALINHIQTEDMKYAEFYQDMRGAPTAAA
jgi:hemerythrin-like metal-binding protein